MIQIFLPLRQRNTLTVVTEYIQYVHSIRGNPYDFVSPVHDVALSGDEDILPLCQEDAFRLANRGGESIKFQIDRWRRRWRWRPAVNHFVRNWRSDWFRNLNKHSENISPGAFIFCVFAGFQQVVAQARIH